MASKGSRPSTPVRAGPSSSSSSSSSSSPSTALGHDRLVFLLLALTGSRVVATLKSGQRYSGILSAATTDSTALNIALRQACQVQNTTTTSTTTAGSGGAHEVINTLLIQSADLVEVQVEDVSVEARIASAAAAAAANGERADGFKTDLQVTGSAFERREKTLQAWGGSAAGGGIEDDAEAILGGGGGGGLLESAGSSRGWDQFAANEKLYGLRTDYDDELYTTKLDRSGADFRAREAKAAALEREILKGGGTGALASNSHMAEERGLMLDDSSLNEEERYSGVIRSEGAYVPPGARKSATLSRSAAANGAAAPPSPNPSLSGSTVATAAQAASAQAQDPSIVSVSRLPATASGTSRIPPAGSPSNSQPVAPASASAGGKPAPPTLEGSFRNFVSLERQRLIQKKEALEKAAERQDKDSKLASLLQFSQSYNLKWPVPDDIAEIAGHDPKKLAAQRAASASASKPATPIVSPERETRTLGAPPASASASTSPSLASATLSKSSGRLSATQIAEIPPFNPARAKARQSPSPTPAVAAKSPAAGTATTATTTTSKINPNAPVFVFKPNPNASSFTPGAPRKVDTPPSSSPAPAPAPAPHSAQQQQQQHPVNPFFGPRQITKRGLSSSATMHVKEDFTPFKTGVVSEPSSIIPSWSFTGKPYRAIYGPVPLPPPPPPPPTMSMPMPMHAPLPPPPPPPSFMPPPPGPPVRFPSGMQMNGGGGGYQPQLSQGQGQGPGPGPGQQQQQQQQFGGPALTLPPPPPTGLPPSQMYTSQHQQQQQQQYMRYSHPHGPHSHSPFAPGTAGGGPPPPHHPPPPIQPGA